MRRAARRVRLRRSVVEARSFAAAAFELVAAIARAAPPPFASDELCAATLLAAAVHHKSLEITARACFAFECLLEDRLGIHRSVLIGDHVYEEGEKRMAGVGTGVRVLLGALARFRSSKALLRPVASALAKVVGTATGAQAVQEAGGVRLLLEALDAQSGSAGMSRFCEACFGFLVAFLEQVEMRPHKSHEQGESEREACVRIVIDALGQHKKEARLQSLGSLVLAQIAHTPWHVPHLISSGGVLALLTANDTLATVKSAFALPNLGTSNRGAAIDSTHSHVVSIARRASLQLMGKQQDSKRNVRRLSSEETQMSAQEAPPRVRILSARLIQHFWRNTRYHEKHPYGYRRGVASRETSPSGLALSRMLIAEPEHGSHAEEYALECLRQEQSSEEARAKAKGHASPRLNTLDLVARWNFDTSRSNLNHRHGTVRGRMSPGKKLTSTTFIVASDMHHVLSGRAHGHEYYVYCCTWDASCGSEGSNGSGCAGNIRCTLAAVPPAAPACSDTACIAFCTDAPRKRVTRRIRRRCHEGNGRPCSVAPGRGARRGRFRRGDGDSAPGHDATRPCVVLGGRCARIRGAPARS